MTDVQPSIASQLGHQYDHLVDSVGAAQHNAEKHIVAGINGIKSDHLFARMLKGVTKYIFDENAPFRKIAVKFTLGDIFLGITDHLAHVKKEEKEKPKDERNIFRKTKDFFVGENNIFHRTKEFLFGEKNFIYRLRHSEGGGFKTLAGILGIMNTSLWFLSGEDSNHDALSRLDNAFKKAEQKHSDKQGSELLEAAIQEARQSGLVRGLRRHGGWLGNFMFTLSGASMMASGVKSKTWFDFANGFGNVIGYGAKALKDFERIFFPDSHVFGDPDDAPPLKDGEKQNIMQRFSRALRYNTEATQSNMGIATTFAGGGTALQYASEGKIAATASQTATFSAYALGDLDLRYTDKQLKWNWIEKNIDILAEQLSWGAEKEARASEAIAHIKTTGNLPEEIKAVKDRVDGIALFGGVAKILKEHHIGVDEKIAAQAAQYLKIFDMTAGMELADIAAKIQNAAQIQTA